MKYFTPSGFCIIRIIFYNNFIPSGLKNHKFPGQLVIFKQNEK